MQQIDLEKLDAQHFDFGRIDNYNNEMPVINKLVTPILALGVVGLSFTLFTILIFVDVKPEAKDILIYILGVLSAAVTQILSYYFGSSQGSKDKAEALKGNSL